MIYTPIFVNVALLLLFGYRYLFFSLTYALAECVTFAYYFEAMCVIGFIRTSFGGPLNAAILTQLFNHIRQENIAGLGSYIDSMHPLANSFSALYNEFQRQILLVSLKEMYGYAVIIAIVILLAILLSDYRSLISSKASPMLKLSEVWKYVRHKTK